MQPALALHASPAACPRERTPQGQGHVGPAMANRQVANQRHSQIRAMVTEHLRHAQIIGKTVILFPAEAAEPHRGTPLKHPTRAPLRQPRSIRSGSSPTSCDTSTQPAKEGNQGVPIRLVAATVRLLTSSGPVASVAGHPSPCRGAVDSPLNRRPQPFPIAPHRRRDCLHRPLPVPSPEQQRRRRRPSIHS